MNRTIQALAAVALLTLSSTINAKGITCEQVANIAAKIMESHQKGVPMSKVIKIYDSQSEAAKEIMIRVTVMAYERPRFHTPEMQRKEIARFRDEFAVGCYGGR